MSAINKTGVVRYNVTTDTHGYPWGHRHGVNGTTIHFDLGDNTVGCNLGELDPPEAMSVEANIALRGNHDTAVMGWDKDEPDEKGGFHLELQTYNDPDNKIAVFGLDVGTKLTSTLEIPARQIYQLAAALSRLDNGWDVIILTHAPLFPGTLKEVAGWNCGYCWGRPGDSEIDKTGTYAEDAEKVITLLNAFKEHKKYSGDNGTIYDFSSSNGRVLGCFAGHIHNSAKVIYKGIPMEAFPTNGADEWTPEKRGSHSNMGLYKPVLSYININFDSKTVNGQSFIHTDSNLCEVTGIGDYYHNESSCFYLDKVSGYFHMQPSPAAHPKFYDGIYLGYSGSPLDGTSFGKNGAQDRYWPFDASIDMKIGARMVQAKGIWFDTNGRLRYYTNSSDTSNYKSYIPIENYRSVKITFTTHNVSWTFQDGLLVSSVPVYKSGSFIGKNGYGITFGSNGVPKGITLNGGDPKDYGTGENYINVTSIQIYSGTDLKELTATPQIGITGTFSALSKIDLARSTSSGANQISSADNVLMRVVGNNNAVIWIYNGKLTALTDQQVL